MFNFKENQFSRHLGVHVCAIHTAHCINTAKICRILSFWLNRGQGQKHGNETKKEVDKPPFLYQLYRLLETS